MNYDIGIDVGSTTTKVVVLDENAELRFSSYRRHKTETLLTLSAILQEALGALGDIDFKLLITGSAGLGISEKYALPFIQEVVASAEIVERLYPQVRTLIDIGGEDAKMIFFNRDGVPDIRMNGSCAGGTGAFIDEMANLLDIPVSAINDLAQSSATIHPMASRCGVFAKTDVQNLLSRDVSRQDIAASVLHAVVLQILATLARGYDPQPLILFSGGPLTFIPALRTAFLKVLKLDETDVLQAKHSELLSAMGAALAHSESQDRYTLAGLLEQLKSEGQGLAQHKRRLRPLFDDPYQRQHWQAARAAHKIEQVDIYAVEGAPCYLGVDSGSTTSKLTLIDEQGRVAFKYYASNKGNAIRAVQDGLLAMRRQFETCQEPPHILRSVVTGYGEDLIRCAFGFDDGMVETLAHFRAARAFDQQVSFILDIGGQDMKAIFVRDGYIDNIEINEACSSGCGSFIESFARSLGYEMADFASLACDSLEPCDLGSRCTVFMNSRVKQALREAAEVSDISAGLAYSVIKNAIYKVLKVSDTSVLGDHIVVQGGTFRNPAIHKALENLVGRPVTCPDLAELMGAYGAALTARDAVRQNGLQPSNFVGLDNLETVSDYEKRQIHCRGCENRCAVTKLIFSNGNVFYTGNRCERTFTNSGKKTRQGVSVHDYKYPLLFDRQAEPPSAPLATIGIPRVLNMYENFPFWNTLLVECGFKVQLSDPSSNELFQLGAASVMSENICFPAKLVHGHIENLIQKGVDRIFYPMVFFEQCEFADAANCFNCPIVSGYPDVVRSAIDPQGAHGIALDQPSISFKDIKLLMKACQQYLQDLGVKRGVIKRAFERALEAQAVYKRQVREYQAKVLREARADGRQVILLLGRPYHLDPLINHGAPRLLTNLGVDVICEDGLPMAEGQTLDNRYILTQWEYLNRYFYAARWAGQQEDVEVVQLNSFACGPDAYTLDEIKNILRSYGKSHTVVRIDEIESSGSTRLRLRSLIETLRSQERPRRVYKPRKAVKLYKAEDREKTVLVPYFSHFCAPTVAGPLLSMGYKLETLPPPDHESVEIGLKYTQNEICYPGIIVIGDLIKALQSGKYDLDNIAVGSWQTGGQCRASSILSLLKRALIAAGFERVPVVALTTNSRLHEQPGFDLNLREYVYKALMAGMYSDTIAAMYYATAVREVNKGEARALADRLLEPLLNGALELNRENILNRLDKAVEAFNGIATHMRSYPRVGIVGEIYVKFNSFVNNRVAQWLIDNQIEVMMPPFLEFFSGWFVSANVQVRENLRKLDLQWLLANVMDRYVSGILDDVEAVQRKFKHYHPSHTIHDLAQKAQQIVALTHQYGEGWLIAGEIGELMEQGVQNVLCLQPFGCIANQVVAKGVAKRLKEKYPALNLLFLDLDAGVSEVNYFNRMYFFINNARQFNA
ncbi:MAG: 2-hydroxyacyl-CoA dehydratase [Anaerolineales bacterium]|nr:2-hydroxyacyl-CoA dehydratase [Anaerolineales bacterium]